MALLHHEGFDGLTAFGSGINLNEAGWVVGGSVATTPGRSGGLGQGIDTSSDQPTLAISTNTNTLTVAAAFKQDELGDRLLLGFGLGGNPQCQLWCLADGKLRLYRGDSAGTVLGTTAAPAYVAGNWFHVQLRVLVADSGTYDVRVADVSVLSGSADTQAEASPGADLIYLGQADAVDDFYLLDSSGAINTTFLGDVKSVAVWPNADTAQIDFTRSAGSTSYTLVDDNAALAGFDEDATYVQSNTSGHIDRYGFPDVGTGITVLGVTAVLRARKTDASAIDLKNNMRLSGSNYSSAGQALGDDYTCHRYLYNASPATSAAWTLAEANAIEDGPEVD